MGTPGKPTRLDRDAVLLDHHVDRTDGRRAGAVDHGQRRAGSGACRGPRPRRGGAPWGCSSFLGLASGRRLRQTARSAHVHRWNSSSPMPTPSRGSPRRPAAILVLRDRQQERGGCRQESLIYLEREGDAPLKTRASWGPFKSGRPCRPRGQVELRGVNRAVETAPFPLFVRDEPALASPSSFTVTCPGAARSSVSQCGGDAAAPAHPVLLVRDAVRGAAAGRGAEPGYASDRGVPARRDAGEHAAHPRLHRSPEDSAPDASCLRHLRSLRKKPAFAPGDMIAGRYRIVRFIAAAAWARSTRPRTWS